MLQLPVTVAERSKAWTVFARWEAGIVARMFSVGMCLFCVCVVLCLGRDVATSWSLAQGVLPSVKIIMKLKKAETRAQGGCRASEKKMLQLRKGSGIAQSV
jgi:hypothetical protein